LQQRAAAISGQNEWPALAICLMAAKIAKKVREMLIKSQKPCDVTSPSLWNRGLRNANEGRSPLNQYFPRFYQVGDKTGVAVIRLSCRGASALPWLA